MVDLDSHFLIDTMVGTHHTRYSASGKHAEAIVDGKTATVRTSGAADPGSDIFPLLEPWAAYADSSIGIHNGGEQTIQGITCKEVDIERPISIALFGVPTDRVRLFITESTGRLRAVQYPMNRGSVYDPHSHILVVYDDYIQKDGLTIPTTITRVVNGHSVTILHILSVDTHQIFDDSALTL